jgi:hypothetical protein
MMKLNGKTYLVGENHATVRPHKHRTGMIHSLAPGATVLFRGAVRAILYKGDFHHDGPGGRVTLYPEHGTNKEFEHVKGLTMLAPAFFHAMDANEVGHTAFHAGAWAEVVGSPEAEEPAVYVQIEKRRGIMGLPQKNPRPAACGAAKFCFTTRKGRTLLTSEKQHGFMHARHFDHTHLMKDGSRVRHRWDNGKLISQRQ